MSNQNDQGRGPFSSGNLRPVSSRPPISIDLNLNETESDAVTELFLGEGSAVPASMPPVHKAKHLAEPHATWKVVGRAEDMDNCDAVAAQLPPFETIVPANVPQTSPTIEAIVQGHLPTFAAAWVTQYARSRAEEMRSAVILLRVRQGNASVECIFPSGTPSISMTQSDSISDAINLAAGMGARYWIIQTDEVNEPDLWQLEQVNRITILTGADEAALVACYRALKGIAQTTTPESETDIHIAVLGAAPEKAAHAIDRVTRAGDNFLGRRVTGSLAAAKIGAGTASTLYRSSSDLPHLREVVETIASLPKPKLTEPLPPSAPTSTPVASSGTREQAVRQEMAALRELHRQEAAQDFDENEAVPASHHARENTNDVVSDLHDPVPVSRPTSLVALIDDIEAIGINCPSAGGVEFGIAPDGRLHLVAHVDGELNSGHPSNQSRAVEDLFVAAAWAISHAKLLLSTYVAIRLDNTLHAPILHIITTKPRDARRLLDTNIRVHLVLRASEDQPWIAMELN